MKKYFVKVISLIMIIEIILISMMPVTNFAESDSDSAILFFDDFDDYTEEYIQKAEKNEIGYYGKDKYVLRNDISSQSYVSGGETKISAGISENIARLVNNVFDTSGGMSLQLISQGIVTKGSMYKSSNISDDNIDGKGLVFSAKFMIPENSVYNNGVGFAVGLSPINVDGTAPDAVCKDKNYQIKENYLKNNYKFLSAQGMEFSVFGEVMDTLKAGEVYNFELKMVPVNNKEYRVFAKLNDYETEIFSDNIPTVNEMKTYRYSFISLHNHGWLTYSSGLNEDGTVEYSNGKPLVYIDDIKFESKSPSEVNIPDVAVYEDYCLFEEDFSNCGTSQGYVTAGDVSEEYENNSFVVSYNAKSIKSDSEKFPGYVTAGDSTKIAKVSEKRNFGSGNSLQLQSQGILYNAAIVKKSNITYEKIKNKTLTFKTEFMIPSAGQWNNGTVAAITISGKSGDQNIQPDSALVSSDFLLSDINSKYMLAGIGLGSDYKRNLQVFGECISEIDDDKVYKLTVVMTPDGTGGYSVSVMLNDTFKTISGGSVPSSSEIGAYECVSVINHSNRWNTSSSHSADDPYINDKDLIFFDNISFNGKPTFFVSSNGDNSNDGNYASPFKTVKRALSMVQNGIGATIIAKSDISLDILPKLPDGQINFCGASASVNLKLADDFECRSDVVFDNLLLAGSSVFANGKKMVIGDRVTTADRITVYGGGNGKEINGDTDICLYGGKYNRVYGGSYNAQVNGSTNVVFGGNCNSGDGIDDGKSNISPCYVYGGGNGGGVLGKTNVTLLDDAVTKYIVGGGEGKLGTVGVSTNINICGGKVMNVYGGSATSSPALSCDTNITITDGVAEGLFGGSEGTNLTGNTHLYLLGGEVTRRVYSGCYNATSGWLVITISTSNHVKGTTNIVMNGKAKLATKASSFSNAGVFSGSRLGSKNAEEVNTLVFLNGSYDSNKSLIGDKSGWSSTFKSLESYTVNVGNGGIAGFAGKGKLNLKPNAGMAGKIGGKIYGAEIVGIPEGVTTVEFVKNFAVNSVTRDKTSGKIFVDYTANNYFNALNPRVYTAIYEKLSDGSLKMLNIQMCKIGDKLVLDAPDKIDNDICYVIKIMFISENLTPMIGVYETVY